MKHIYREMVTSGLWTPAQYEEKTGEPYDLEKPKLIESAGPVLEQGLFISDEKKEDARRARMEAMGLTPGEYNVPSAEALARADRVRFKKKTFKTCVRDDREVEQCPVGDVYKCSQHTRCPFASLVIVQSEGKRGKDMYVPPDDDTPLTLTERAATRSGNKLIQQQAMQTEKLRRQIEERKKK